MKILFVFSHPAPYKVKIFNEIAKDNDIFVLFERKNKNRNPLFYKQEKIAFKFKFIHGLKIGNENIISLGIKHYLKKHHNEYDQIVMNGYSSFAEMSAIKWLKRHNIKYTLMINGGLIKHDSPIKKHLKTKYISGANRYLCPTEVSKHYLIYYGANQNRIYLYHYSNIKNSNLIANCAPYNKKELKNKYNMPNGYTFISIGQFIDRKNNLELLQVFKNTNDNLLLVGEGKELSLYKKYIKENNLKNVTIFPYQNEEIINELLLAADAYISLSKEDIFGHTIIEALAKNLPVIASNKILSAKEIIKNNNNGYIVKLDNPTQIVDACNKIKSISSDKIYLDVIDFTIEQSTKDIIKVLKHE